MKSSIFFLIGPASTTTMFSLLVLIFYATRARAVYYVDNFNTSIEYSGAGWHKYSDPLAFNGSVTWGNCVLSDKCQFMFPFTGYGITIYLADYRTDNIHANITISSYSMPNSTTTKTFSAPDMAKAYNFILYEDTSLPLGNYNVSVLLLDWVDGGGSWLTFDFATVQDVAPTSPPPPSPPPPPPPGSTCTLPVVGATESCSAGYQLRANLGGIIGSAIGGLVILEMIAILLSPSAYATQSTDTAASPPDHTSKSPSDHASLRGMGRSDITIKLSSKSSASGIPLLPSPSAASPGCSASAHMSGNTSGAPLTDEHADLLNGPWSIDVPVADMAGVAEMARAGGQRSVLGEVGGGMGRGSGPLSCSDRI